MECWSNGVLEYCRRYRTRFRSARPMPWTDALMWPHWRRSQQISITPLLRYSGRYQHVTYEQNLLLQLIPLRRRLLP